MLKINLHMATNINGLVNSIVIITVQWITMHVELLKSRCYELLVHLTSSLSQNHLRVGRGPTGVTRLDVVMRPTEVFLRDWESLLELPASTFLVLAAVGFM